MTDNPTTERPVRRLTVKNFSVIKDATLDFGKITVLIGPQASGKSLLCKLAYFLSNEVLEYAVASISGTMPYDEFVNGIIEKFKKRYFTKEWLHSEFNIEYVSEKYSIKIFAIGTLLTTTEVDVQLSSEFASLYADLIGMQPDRNVSLLSREDIQKTIWASLGLLLSSNFITESLYIPAGRAFFTSALKGYSALRNPELDPLIGRFAEQIIWNGRWKEGLLTAGDGVLEEIRTMMNSIAQGLVYVVNDEPMFRTLKGGRTLPLTLQSSGTQELLPLFSVIDRMASNHEHIEILRKSTRSLSLPEMHIAIKNLFYLEEPEANVFPATQNDLVRLFARLSNEPNIDFSWVITTHSPYLITAFNVLLDAARAAKARPERADEVDKIIPRSFWLQREDFAAYGFDGTDGMLRPMMDEENGLINGDVLDNASELIGADFDKLMDVEYGD